MDIGYNEMQNTL